MKVYRLPEGIEAPDFADAIVNGRYDYKRDDELTEQFFAKLKTRLQELGYTGPLTGEKVYFPIADGKAVYMVAESKKTTALIHCPIGDAWDLPEWQTRGLTKTEVKKMVEGHRRMAELFGRKA